MLRAAGSSCPEPLSLSPGLPGRRTGTHAPSSRSFTSTVQLLMSREARSRSLNRGRMERVHGSLLKKTAHGAVTWSGLHGGGRQGVRSRRTTWSRSDQITGDVCGSFKRFMSPGRAEVRDGLFYHFTGRSSHFPGCQLVSVRPHLVIFTR